MMAHTLPPLPYAYDSLEPYIDKETMQIHHDKHHQTYVDKLNKSIEGHQELQDKPIEEILKNLNSVSESVRNAVRNFGGGHANHSFFWTILKKDVKINGEILKAITKDFGSYEYFEQQFKQKAVTHFGSGWAWLVLNPSSRKLEIMETHDQESPLTFGKVPLLVIDLWEHSFYLKWKADKKGYVDNFPNVINWDKVNEYYLEATKV
ncbi:superoxide dismutase [Candidatus Gottesmanbacteria bacterium]|nr:superoxide dismutase [Candidatus Gottesmanbacteria bacterium]